MKRKQKPTKKREICKYHENWFHGNWFFEEKIPFEEIKTVMKSVRLIPGDKTVAVKYTISRFLDLRN